MATLSSPARSFTSQPHLHHRKYSHRLSRFSSLSFTLSICSPLLASFPATSSSSCSSSRSHTGLSFSVNAGAAEDKKAKKKKVLIVNTDGGGHAVIGFYFAKALPSSGHEVTIMIVGEESSENMKKPPFNRLSEIVSAGGRTVWGSPTEVGKIFHGTTFDVVLDNNGKDIDTVRPVADWAKGAGVEQFLYISSAGIYKPTDEPPHVEGDAVKGDASHVGVEAYIAEIFGCWAVFRPQYMIGSGNNKDCEEWFFDRIVRNRRVPIPGSGMQLTNIAHVRDLSSMLALAVAKPDAANATVFNCVSDRAVTLDGMARLCAEAAGHPLQLVHYNPKAVGINLRKAFPFRDMHFYAEPRAAKDLLGWQCTTNLVDDLKERYAEYVRTGRDKKPMQFEVDDEILEFLKVPVAV